MEKRYRGYIVVNNTWERPINGTLYLCCGASELFLNWYDALLDIDTGNLRQVGLAEAWSIYEPRYRILVVGTQYMLDPVLRIWKQDRRLWYK